MVLSHQILGFLGLVLVVVFQETHSKRTYTDQELDTWEASDEIKRMFPYYYTGLDYEDQPVFVFENGKWNLRKMFEDGTSDMKVETDKYMEQMFYRWTKEAHELYSKNGTGTGKFGIICDFEGYDAWQLAHIPTNLFVFTNITLRFQNEFSKNLDYVFVLNVNYVAETLVGILKPALGEVAAQLEILGTNKEKWTPLLLKKIPKKSLPPWYGGFSDYKPIAVYG